jgi:hypothetical protein
MSKKEIDKKIKMHKNISLTQKKLEDYSNTLAVIDLENLGDMK